MVRGRRTVRARWTDAPDAAPAQLPKVMADARGAAAILGDGKAEAMFERGYRQIVALPSALAAYRRFFATLAAEDRRPLLFHCTTGKDRTGWAAAVTLTLLGVSAEDVMRDYILTNDQLLPALRPVVDRFVAAGGDPDLLQPVLGVRPGYLEAAFDEARQRYGSMDRYLAAGLGIDDGLRQRLRDDLTEEAAR
jgi:protein-tyrosine phosphatase